MALKKKRTSKKTSAKRTSKRAVKRTSKRASVKRTSKRPVKRTSARKTSKRTSKRTGGVGPLKRIKVKSVNDLTMALRYAWLATLQGDKNYAKRGNAKLISEIKKSVKPRHGEATFLTEFDIISSDEDPHWEKLHRKAESYVRKITGDKGYYIDAYDDHLYVVHHV